MYLCNWLLSIKDGSRYIKIGASRFVHNQFLKAISTVWLACVIAAVVMETYKLIQLAILMIFITSDELIVYLSSHATLLTPTLADTWVNSERLREILIGNTKNVKGKSVPLRAWSGPEGSRKLRFPDFMTTAQDGSKVVGLTHRPPLPQEMLLVLISVSDPEGSRKLSFPDFMTGHRMVVRLSALRTGRLYPRKCSWY